MKALILMASILLTVGWAGATENTNTDKPTPSRKDKSHLGTSFRFDGTSLHGKYQSAPGTTSTVENDKYLDDLLSAPKNFKDRAQADADRN